MKDYSQDGEQHHILTACPEDSGMFLDLGAWHPTEKSNTRALFEKGWCGVCLEPSPGPFENLLKEYGDCERVTLYNAAVARNPGSAMFWITDDATSTCDPAIYRKWNGTVRYNARQIEVATITLEMLYEKHGPFGFVNIDTEGTSVDHFARLMDLGHRPKCIALEYDERLAEARDIAKRCGYQEVQYNGTNIVLVHRG